MMKILKKYWPILFTKYSPRSWFGLVLRDSKLISKKDLNDIETLAREGKNKDEEGYRSEFIRLVETYKTIQK
jgi:Ca-activated chloride channel family protein